MAENKGPCGVCKGAYNEHFDSAGKPMTQHAYVDEGGTLMTHKEAAEVQTPQRPSVVMPPPYMGNAGLSVGRLCEVLIDREIISPEDALYIAGISNQRKTPSFDVDTSGGGV